MNALIPPALDKRRLQTEEAWHCFQGSPAQKPITHHQPQNQLSQVIQASWQRSEQHLPTPAAKAPLADPYETRFRWQESPIREVSQRELGQLIDMTRESHCVAAISDVAGRLLWTYASPHMETRAADEHFISGGYWRERHTGTNAIGLSLKTRTPATVFAAEHYNASLHEWVCYAAPIIHPKTDELLGVLDLSSTWEQYNPLGCAAVKGMAQSISQNLLSKNLHFLLKPYKSAELELRLLGNPHIIFLGKPLRLSLRHHEILALLSMHPDGIEMDKLHAALYGDYPVSKGTLKSEISKLRALLNGGIASRPYRLDIDCHADFIELWKALKNQQLDQALQLYRGSLLINSNSPEIEQWRYCIDAVMEKQLNGYKSLNSFFQQCDLSNGELIREYLINLL